MSSPNASRITAAVAAVERATGGFHCGPPRSWIGPRLSSYGQNDARIAELEEIRRRGEAMREAEDVERARANVAHADLHGEERDEPEDETGGEG